MATKRKLLEQAWRDLVLLHHEAILIEVYGLNASGVPPERVQQMLDQGILNPADLQGMQLPGLDKSVDPLAFMYRVAKIIEAAPPGQRPEMRDWTIDQWATQVNTSVQETPEAPVDVPISPVGIPKPDRSADASGRLIELNTVPVEVPEWMGTGEAAAYTQAATRAGEFCRGLGNTLANEVSEAVEEVWEATGLVEEADALLREIRTAEIRDKVSEALATHRDYSELALELARTTEKYAHNWERIARTELQGAYNEGVILEAIEDWGEGAQIARVTETNACGHCIRLFRNPDWTPRVFPIKELLANGTNVGRPATSWVATIWPVHPNCRCDTLNVPPGMSVNADGVLEMEKRNAD